MSGYSKEELDRQLAEIRAIAEDALSDVTWQPLVINPDGVVLEVNKGYPVQANTTGKSVILPPGAQHGDIVGLGGSVTAPANSLEVEASGSDRIVALSPHGLDVTTIDLPSSSFFGFFYAYDLGEGYIRWFYTDPWGGSGNYAHSVVHTGATGEMLNTTCTPGSLIGRTLTSGIDALTPSQIQALVDTTRQTSAVGFAANQDDFAPGGAASWRTTWWVRLNPSADNLEITGLAAPTTPTPQEDFVYQKRLVNMSDKDIFLTHEDANSVAANRIITNIDGGDVRGHIPPRGVMDVYYDLEQTRWRIAGVSINALESQVDAGEPAAFVRLGDGKTYAADMSRDNSRGAALVSLPQAGFAGTPVKGAFGTALSFVLWGTEGVLTSSASISYTFSHLGTHKKLNAVLTLDHVGATFNWGMPTATPPLLGAGAYGRVRIIQGTGGNKTITTWTTSTGVVKWPGGVAPTLSLNVGEEDVIEWYSPDGVNVYASLWNSDHEILTNNPHAVTAAQAGTYTSGQIDVLIDATLKPPEAFAPSGTYPVTYGGSGVQQGDSFRIGAAGAMGAVTVNTEDLLIALVDTPGQTDGNWMVVESNRDQATETVKGVAELATQAEADAGANDTHIITALKMATIAVRKTDFDVGTFLYATADDTPEPKTQAETRALLQTASFADFYIDASDFVSRTTNGAAAATEETGTNDRMLQPFLFDPVIEEAIQRKFKMPDDWDLGTFKVKIDWDGNTGASAGDVVLWGVKGVAIGNNEDLDGAWGTEVEVSDVLLQNDGGKMQTTAATAAITIGGTPAIDDKVWLQVARKAGDGSDTMDAEDGKFLGIAIQYGVLATTPAAW